MNVTNFGLPLINLTLQLMLATFDGSYAQYGELVKYNTTVGIERPVYYVLKRDDGLFIMSRGSVDSEDWVTDLEFTEKETEYGVYHAGFFNASMYVYENAKPWIAEAKTPIYCVGHSYGASVATVLSTLIMHDFPEKDTNCVAFAPAVAMSQEVNATYYNKIVCFYNHNDIIPTLSVPNVYERFKWVFTFSYPEEKVVEIIRTVISGIEHVLDPWSQEVYEGFYNAIPKLVELLYEYHEKQDLKLRYIPGTVYHVYANKKVAKLTDNVIDVPNELNIMGVHISGFIDHNPSQYEKAIKNIEAI